METKNSTSRTLQRRRYLRQEKERRKRESKKQKDRLRNLKESLRARLAQALKELREGKTNGQEDINELVRQLIELGALTPEVQEALRLNRAGGEGG